MNVSLSPNKSQRSKIGNKKEFNEIQNAFGCDILKKNTLPKNFGFNNAKTINFYSENNNTQQYPDQPLRSSNAKNTQSNSNNSNININPNLKKNELKKSGKLKDKRNSYINSIRPK